VTDIAEQNNEDDLAVLRFDAAAGDRMAKEIERLLARFISYPNINCRTAHVLWIIHTHVVQHFETTPRLAFLSPEPASGKTRALEITERLVPNPVSAINVTPAYLFRKVGAGETTILFDEIDTVFGPKAKENEEIRGLLNAGHRRGAVAGRCVIKGKNVETEEISAFAPVALAGLGWLPDTIMSRSVVVRMQRRAANEVVEPYRRRIHDAVTDGVRTLIEVWARGAWLDGLVWPELPKEVQDRDADVWEPLIAIADELGGGWPKKAREAAVALVTASKEREPSLGIRLLTDLHEVFQNREAMATTAILEALHNLAEAPWRDLKGKPLNDRGLSGRLKQYSIKSKNIRVGEDVHKGYTREDLTQAWLRYLPALQEKSATSATSATTHININENNGVVVALSRANVAATEIAATNSEISATEKRKQYQFVRSNVALVADVADFPGKRDRCAHCGEGGDTLEVASAGQTVRLHRECIDRWVG
jgi:hypothetical protein